MTVSLDVLKALADETRLKIISLLSEYDYCVGALSRRVGVSPAAISQHLQLMRRAGLVRGEKRGYWTHYSVEAHVIAGLAAASEKLTGSDAVERNRCRRGDDGERCRPGKEVLKMCECKHPEKRPEQGKKCSLEQIRECHGEERSIPAQRKNRNKLRPAVLARGHPTEIGKY